MSNRFKILVIEDEANIRSFAKTILEAHNLRFGVISKKDVGSNFFIEFLVCDE